MPLTAPVLQGYISLTVEGQRVVLFPATSIPFVWNNILFSEDIVPGSYSLPFDVPAFPNGHIFGFPEILGNSSPQRKEYSCELECEGLVLNGLLKVRKVTTSRYTLNIQIGYSAFGESVKSRSLQKFDFGDERQMGDDLKEILNHMADTATNPQDHDYVFAPVQNTALFGEKNPQFGGIVNRWVIDPYPSWDPLDTTKPWLDADGNQVYSHFAYNLAFNFNILDPMAPSWVYAICPFPSLKYVLSAIVEELGATLKEEFFDEELSRLYVLSNTVLDKVVIFENGYRGNFRIGEVLPDITFSEFLQALRDTFALSVQIGLDKTVSIQKLRDLLASNDYLDLTAFAAPAHEITQEEPSPMTIGYKLDDEVASERVKDFEADEVIMKEAVPSVVDLNALVGPEHTEVRLVTGINQYYRYSLVEEPFGWAFYSDNYLPLAVAGGGERVEQGIALTLDQFISFPDPSSANGLNTYKLPSYGVPGTSKVFGLHNPMKSLRLAFYRGFQPVSETTEKTYPLLSFDNLNARGQEVGEYSLRLDGEKGTYNRFQKEWLELKANARPVVKPLYLDMATLLKIDFNRKVNVGGNRFLIKQLKFSLPLRKEVVAELVQTKK